MDISGQRLRSSGIDRLGEEQEIMIEKLRMTTNGKYVCAESRWVPFLPGCFGG